MAADPTQKPTDKFSTPETLNYIHQLYHNWQNTKSQYEQVQKNHSVLKVEKQNIGEEYTRIRVAKAEAKDNLKSAEEALNKVEKIVRFFKSRKSTTGEMVSFAGNMAQKIFEATEFINKEALERVEEIKEKVTAFDKKDDPKNGEQWSELFTTKIIDSDKLGQAAFTAGVTAVKAAFNAYVSNQQIHSRTINYLQKFTSFESELRGIITRLGQEQALINRRYIILEGKNEAIDSQMADLSIRLQNLEFETVQAHAEYNAAQQGAEYKYTPATSPAG